jgi:hypothetical protein
MLERLETAFQDEQLFAANAAHQLRQVVDRREGALRALSRAGPLR